MLVKFCRFSREWFNIWIRACSPSSKIIQPEHTFRSHWPVSREWCYIVLLIITSWILTVRSFKFYQNHVQNVKKLYALVCVGFDAEGIERLTKVTNSSNYFKPPCLCLSQYLEDHLWKNLNSGKLNFLHMCAFQTMKKWFVKSTRNIEKMFTQVYRNLVTSSKLWVNLIEAPSLWYEHANAHLPPLTTLYIILNMYAIVLKEDVEWSKILLHYSPYH